MVKRMKNKTVSASMFPLCKVYFENIGAEAEMGSEIDMDMDTNMEAEMNS